MPLSVQQFIENLSQTGLMSAAEVSALCELLPNDQRPRDATTLAEFLVRIGRLTSYQATAILKGQHRALVFHEYVILDRIGAGGMGVVLKARHRRMDRTVAIKVLPTAAMKSQEAVERFYREVRAVARLSHPNIVAAHDASEHDGMHYLVMEYVDGRDLAAVVHEQGALTIDQAVDCILQAAKGLEYAHAMGIVHRDIKPSNLLLTRDGLVKILDLGLALLGEGGGSQAPAAGQLTQTGQIMGTLDYMSPEQAVNTHQADERSDIYSLGATLHTLLTARPLYHGDTVVAVLVAHREAPIPSLCAARDDVPQALDAVFQRMVAKEPAGRQPSMSQVITELKACLVGDVAQSALAVEPSSGSALSELARTASGEVATVKPQSTTAADQETLKLTHQDQDTGKQLPAAESALAGGPAKPGRRRSRLWLSASGGIALFIVLAAVFGRQFLPVTKNGDGTGNGDTGNGDTGNGGIGNGGTEQSIPFAAGGEAGQEWSSNHLAMKFCWCPPGEFTMGEGATSVNVKLTRGFWLGKYEVTQAEYAQFKKGHRSHFSATGPARRLVAELNTDKFPVESVSWAEAAEFCAALTEREEQAGRLPKGWEYRLPTDAQWEYACRAGTQSGYSFGETDSKLGDYAWYDANADKRTHEVGQKQANAWGLHDMHGNVFEWSRDWYAQKPPGGTDPEVTEQTSKRPYRGGGWAYNARDCRSAFRFASPGGIRSNHTGFRVAIVQTETPSSLSAGTRAGQEWENNGLAMKFCWCPPGDFKMGEGAGAVDVTLTRGFWIGKYEVTQAEYRRVTKGNPSYFREAPKAKDGAPGEDKDKLPVEQVTWPTAMQFCKTLTEQERLAGRLLQDWEYRLPTEAQWEYACRAGTKTTFSFGNGWPQLGDYAWHKDNAGERTREVGKKLPNPWGLYDMYGNVSEWCRDRYAEMLPGGADPEVTAQSDKRVLRGGAWLNAMSGPAFHSGNREVFASSQISFHIGFRVALVQMGESEIPPRPSRYALTFDGKSSHVSIPSFRYKGNHPLTLEAWAVLDRPTTDDALEVLMGDPEKAGICINSGPGKWQFFGWFGGYVHASEKRPVPRQRLVHLAGVYDGKSEIRFYVDGELQSRTPIKQRYKESPLPFTLGANPDPGGRFTDHFLGRIAEVRISKVAQYDKDFTPKKRFEPDKDTIALYHFDEGQGSVLKDASDNHHDGEIVGAKWVKVSAGWLGLARPVAPVTLFDGRSLKGWRGLESEELPAGWRVEDDSIVGPGNKTYLATADSYADFEFEVQWKLARSANAGIFYRWGGELRAPDAGLGDPLAPEYQIVDNANHPNGKKLETATGSVFNLIGPTKDATKPAGQWNATRLVVRGAHVEHWLNGEKVVEYEYGSDDWKRQVAAHPRLSKEPEYGRAARGRILLQSYSGQVWYRDIQIKATDGVARPDG